MATNLAFLSLQPIEVADWLGLRHSWSGGNVSQSRAGHGEARMADDEAETWLPLNEASQRLGITIDALRSRVRRGLIESRKGNDGRIVVRVAGQPATGHDQPPDDHLRQELQEARAEADHWRTQAEQARLEARDHKARLEGLREQLERERALAEQERARADRLEARLALPWWRRLIG